MPTIDHMKFLYGLLVGLVLIYGWQAYGDTALEIFLEGLTEAGERAQEEVGAPTADSGW